VGGARLYRSQTARVNAPVRPLIASGPPIPPSSTGCRPGPGSWPFQDLCRHTVRQITVINTVTSTLGNPLLRNDSYLIVTPFPANKYLSTTDCNSNSILEP
jgi:hypothetical protein